MNCSRCHRPIRVAYLTRGGIVVLNPNPSRTGEYNVYRDPKTGQDTVAEGVVPRGATRYDLHPHDCAHDHHRSTQ